MSDDAGTVDDDAPSQEEPSMLSTESADDEQRQEGQPVPAERGGDGVEWPVEPPKAPDLAQLGEDRPDEDQGHSPATHEAEHDPAAPDGEATGQRDEEARPDRSQASEPTLGGGAEPPDEPEPTTFGSQPTSAADEASAGGEQPSAVEEPRDGSMEGLPSAPERSGSVEDAGGGASTDPAQRDPSEAAFTATDSTDREPSGRHARDALGAPAWAAPPTALPAGAAVRGSAADFQPGPSMATGHQRAAEGPSDTTSRPLNPGDARALERAVAAALAGGLRPVSDTIDQPERARRHRAKSAPLLERPDSASPARDGDARAPRAHRPPRAPRLPRGGSGAGGGMEGLPWRYMALALVAVLCVGLIAAAIVKTRNDAALAGKEAAAYTAPPLPSPSPSQPPAASTPPIVSVVGDQLTAGSSSDSGTRSEWPALLASALHAEVKTFAAPGAGYVTKGVGGATLVSEAGQVDRASRVVVLFGGGNDVSNSPPSVATAATIAISAAQAAAPRAQIVLVGPLSPVGTPSPALLAIRDGLQSAAKDGKAGWHDPISGGWLSSSSSLSTSSGTLNDQGEKALEFEMQSVLKALTQQ